MRNVRKDMYWWAIDRDPRGHRKYLHGWSMSPDNYVPEPIVPDAREVGLSKLAEALRPSEESPDRLCKRARQLIERSGVITTVDDQPMLVTPAVYTAPFRTDGQSVFIRLAQSLPAEPGTQPAPPHFLFCSSKSLTDIKSLHQPGGRLFFREYGGAMHLYAGPDDTTRDYETNNPTHISLANSALHSLERQQPLEQTTSADHRLAKRVAAVALSAVLSMGIGAVIDHEAFNHSPTSTVQKP